MKPGPHTIITGGHGPTPWRARSGMSGFWHRAAAPASSQFVQDASTCGSLAWLIVSVADLLIAGQRRQGAVRVGVCSSRPHGPAGPGDSTTIQQNFHAFGLTLYVV